MTIHRRCDQEAAEHSRLRPDASFADKTRGRAVPVTPDTLRTDYQRDRDRIIHCKSFRRLSHKTQVFLAPEGDHYRTRLTHTLEVSQISRTISRALRLNEDLTEAIALGHDLGHTPFGHTGEQALSRCIAKRRGLGNDAGLLFRHNEQSLRVVDVLENDGAGLNLTAEVRDGILCHTSNLKAATLEGQVVGIADRIAYVNHDIDDAIRGEVISEDDLPRSTHEILGSDHSARITTLVCDLVEESDETGEIRMTPEVYEAMMELRAFLFENVYTSPAAKSQEPKASALIASLFDFYIQHPDEVPDDLRRIARDHPSTRTPDDPDCTAVIDHIASMTDRYARGVYEDIFIPENWRTV